MFSQHFMDEMNEWIAIDIDRKKKMNIRSGSGSPYGNVVINQPLVQYSGSGLSGDQAGSSIEHINQPLVPYSGSGSSGDQAGSSIEHERQTPRFPEEQTELPDFEIHLGD